MNSENESAFSMPELASLPGVDASFREIGRFIHHHDPTLYFHKAWGDDYQENVHSLWQRLNNAFQNGETTAGQVDELLMGMAYHWALGPYLGVPDSKKQEFLAWLLAEIRRQLENRA